MAENKLSTKERNDKLGKLFEYHIPTFKSLGIENPDFFKKNPEFYGKNAFKQNRNGVEEDFISLYEREVVLPEFYVELVEKTTYELLPGAGRVLYKYSGNEHSKSEYFKYTTSYGDLWFVPVSELLIVSPQEQGELTLSSKANEVVLEELPELVYVSEDAEDTFFSKMTIRDYVAIHHKKPVSKRPWLNKLITEEL